ncbi:hypothetical protein K458DRAFT_410255 [Lentithecium fluviatile CBS 122367]|uniref:Uncharacterized protein n=1 Tax=Lentithecium fluviatile CBS 122367 TaxID=1168545 RepID=A0A6G1IEL4_9PLEO|nr:hypothetical protein K458DRAFT_410255 [Lentithecium fluviatile CBS 122367]
MAATTNRFASFNDATPLPFLPQEEQTFEGDGEWKVVKRLPKGSKKVEEGQGHEDEEEQKEEPSAEEPGYIPAEWDTLFTSSSSTHDPEPPGCEFASEIGSDDQPKKVDRIVAEDATQPAAMKRKVNKHKNRKRGAHAQTPEVAALVDGLPSSPGEVETALPPSPETMTRRQLTTRTMSTLTTPRRVPRHQGR